MWFILAEIIFALVLVVLIYRLTLPRKAGEDGKQPPESSG
jgi:hypothetical protein